MENKLMFYPKKVKRYDGIIFNFNIGFETNFYTAKGIITVPQGKWFYYPDEVFELIDSDYFKPIK